MLHEAFFRCEEGHAWHETFFSMVAARWHEWSHLIVSFAVFWFNTPLQ